MKIIFNDNEFQLNNIQLKMTFNFEMFRLYNMYMYVFTPPYSTTAWYHTYCSKNINCTLYMLPHIDGATCHYVKALSSSGQLLVIY